MATTKYKIAEQIIKMLTAQSEAAASPFSINEIKIAVEQRANLLLKMEYFPINDKYRDTIPSGASVATYETNTVERYRKVSKIVLPAMPIKLPRNIGVYQIIDENGTEFIPIEMGQRSLLSSQLMINDLLGQTGYEVYGKDVIFSKDLTVPDETVNVVVRLIVLDISQYEDYDLLPIPADLEAQLIEQVYKMYVGRPTANLLVDSTSGEQTGVPIDKQKQT